MRDGGKKLVMNFKGKKGESSFWIMDVYTYRTSPPPPSPVLSQRKNWELKQLQRVNQRRYAITLCNLPFLPQVPRMEGRRGEQTETVSIPPPSLLLKGIKERNKN